MDFTVLTSPIRCLVESKVLYPICCINRPSKNKYDFVNGFHVSCKSHNLCGFVLDILKVLELLGLRAEFALPIEYLLSGAVPNKGVGPHSS